MFLFESRIDLSITAHIGSFISHLKITIEKLFLKSLHCTLLQTITKVTWSGTRVQHFTLKKSKIKHI